MEQAMIGIRVLVLALTLALPCGAWGQEQIAQAQSAGTTFPPAETSVSSQIEARRDPPATTSRGGAAVDASGDPADDPTANVIALQRAATQRQDDLREGSERFTLAQMAIQFAAAEVLNKERMENAAKLAAAESKRIDDLLAQRNDYEQRLAVAEANRIDAIRAVDVNAAQNATVRAVEQASVLADQLDRSAETSRTLVSTTEQSLAASQRQSFTEFSNRITALEQSQSFGQGRQTVSDPAVVALTEQVSKLTLAQSASVGQSTGSSSAVLWAIAAMTALATIISIAGGLIAIFRRPTPAVTNGNGNGGPN